MAQDLEKAISRLQNIEAVGPILGALRTISLGNWQLAIKKRKNILLYNNQLLDLVPHLLPNLKTRHTIFPRKHTQQSKKDTEKILVVGIGTERGLCGRYNNVLGDFLISHIEDHKESNHQISLGILGSRLLRSIQRAGVTPDWTGIMPVNSLPSFQSANIWVTRWLHDFEAEEINRVYIVLNKQESAGRYQPWATELIPTNPPEKKSSRTMAAFYR